MRKELVVSDLPTFQQDLPVLLWKCSGICHEVDQCHKRTKKEYRKNGDWSIISCYKGKGDAFDRTNCRGLKLQYQVMNVILRVLSALIIEQVDIDSMQFGFIPGRGATDGAFIMIVNLEKAFDRIPRSVLWRVQRLVGTDEWCWCGPGHVQVDVTVGIHQGGP